MAAPAPTRLFAYGTLLAPEVLEEVTCRAFAAEPALLAGFQRHALRGRVYPGIVPHPDARVDGLLIREVDAASWHLLDRFEGEVFTRQSVRVRLASGAEQDAETYVLNEKGRALLEPAPWDYETFRTCHLRAYLDGIDA